MKRVFSKITTVLFAVIMCLSVLAGSGRKTVQAEEKFIIGIVVYDNTDLLVQYITKYSKEVLGPAFNCEFIVSDAIKDANMEISFLENIASKGGKGIIAGYSVTDPKVLLAKCKQLGLYYIWGLKIPEPGDIKAGEGNPYFLGGIGASTGDYTACYDMTMSFLQGGARKIAMATGGKDFGIKMFVDRYKGVFAAIKDFKAKNPDAKITFNELGGFPNDSWFAGQAKMIASNPDAIIAYSAVFLWIQPLANAGKTEKIKLGTIEGMYPVAAQTVADGKVAMMGAIYASMVGLPFTVLYNALTGYSKDIIPDGKAVSIDLPMPVVKSPEEMKKWMSVENATVKPISIDDLKKLCKKFNPKAGYADLVKLCNETDYDSIVKRRNADKAGVPAKKK